MFHSGPIRGNSLSQNAILKKNRAYNIQKQNSPKGASPAYAGTLALPKSRKTACRENRKNILFRHNICKKEKSGENIVDIKAIKQQLQKSKAQFDEKKNQVSVSISRQVSADYDNCEQALDILEQTGAKADYSLFEWLVREFSDEVNTITEMDELHTFRVSEKSTHETEDDEP